jgi:hypothetical protein
MFIFEIPLPQGFTGPNKSSLGRFRPPQAGFLQNQSNALFDNSVHRDGKHIYMAFSPTAEFQGSGHIFFCGTGHVNTLLLPPISGRVSRDQKHFLTSILTTATFSRVKRKDSVDFGIS